jgi:hypothetical protein
MLFIQLEDLSLDPSLQLMGCRTMWDVIPEERLNDYKTEFEEDMKGLLVGDP